MSMLACCPAQQHSTGLFIQSYHCHLANVKGRLLLNFQF